MGSDIFSVKYSIRRNVKCKIKFRKFLDFFAVDLKNSDIIAEGLKVGKGGHNLLALRQEKRLIFQQLAFN